MKKFIHSVVLLLFVLFVASCAKDELEAPGDNSGEIRALDTGAVQDRKDDASIENREHTWRGGGIGDEVPDINDDDDEEDEDRNPDKD